MTFRHTPHGATHLWAERFSASGVVFFAAYASVTIGNKTIDALIYSVTYNGSYLAVEEIITIIVISIPPVKKALDYVKQMANSR